MTRRSLRPVLVVVVMAASTMTAGAQLSDVRGTKDHPLVSRYAGSVIIGHNVRKFDEFVIPLAAVTMTPQRTFEPAKKQRVEGAVTRILYVGPPERSPLEVMRNYDLELKKAGFQPIYSCAAAECGVASTLPNFLYPTSKQLRQTPAGSGIISSTALSFPADQRYMAAKLARPQGDVYVSVYVATNKSTIAKETVNRPIILLDVIETVPMETGMVTVDAAAMAKDISSTGHVALYGIYFDTDKSDIKAESQATLEQISKLLKQDSSLKLYIVGHTDNAGTFEYNIGLSERRAAAVVRELTTKYGIAAPRLKAAGVGMLSPVAPNDSEQGRAKNRRVELVKQ